MVLCIALILGFLSCFLVPAGRETVESIDVRVLAILYSLMIVDSHPLQYSCLEKSMDRGAWQTTVHGVAKSQTQLSN